MPETTCPICDEPIETIDRVGPVTYELSPCGHHVDDRIREDLTTAGE